MNYVVEFGLIALAHAMAVISPGPDFALVLRQSVAHGRGGAVATALGIGSGIFVHVTYALLGVGWVLHASPQIFTALKVVGAIYFVWLGWQSWRAAAAAAEAETSPSFVTNPGGPGWSRAWRRGFLTNVLNPKATLFFVALFSVGIDPTTPRWVLALYGVWMAGATATWFSVVGLVLSQPSVRQGFLRRRAWLDRAMGVVFWAFAASLLIVG